MRRVRDKGLTIGEVSKKLNIPDHLAYKLVTEYLPAAPLVQEYKNGPWIKPYPRLFTEFEVLEIEVALGLYKKRGEERRLEREEASFKRFQKKRPPGTKPRIYREWGWENRQGIEDCI